MSNSTKITFVSLSDKGEDVFVLPVKAEGEVPAISAPAEIRLGEALAARLKAVMAAEAFKAKSGNCILLPAETGVGDAPVSILLFGVDGDDAEKPRDFLRIGGKIFSKLPKNKSVSLFAAGFDGADAAEMALGIKLAAYTFTKYQTRKKPDEPEDKPLSLTIHVDDPAASRKAMKARDAVYSGVALARDLVNEPPNVLTPVEFADRAAALEKLGVEIEVLDEKALKKLGMRALLGVGQGSRQESRVVIMRWQGAKDEKAAPLAFIGKGVVFDSGGISIKSAGGMEDMKGDMAGAAAVVGLLHTLASRKAKVNVVGAIGLVENMPDGNAQRPGDIVTSMSGQTIEIINTDAEGRLVLADVLWHVKQKFNPVFMVNLATLTGAIIVALGHDYAGLFSNHEELAANLLKAGEGTGEKLWRMPLGKEYDKQIDSKFADMKNAGVRNGGSITAAQFLQRFVDGCPWAHLDIAGTAMASPATDINRSWGSGFGVRLLDRLVEGYEE